MMELLEQLCGLRGVSGDEGRVAEFITKQIDGHCRWQIDALGSVIVLKKGRQQPQNKLMLCAQMDEAGFLVTGYTEEGLLRFSPVGGLDSRVVIGKPVLVGDTGLPGVVGAKAVHMVTSEERDKPLKTDKLYIDLGFKTKGEAEQAVTIGERVTFDAGWVHFGNQLRGRAIGARAGCAALIRMIQGELEYDTAFVFAAQGETGGAGAQAAAFTVAPDFAITVEAAPAADIPGIPEEKQGCRLGGGPALAFLDGGSIYDTGLYRLALQTAENHEIPVQNRQDTAGKGMARVIQPSRGGVRCVAVGIPCRYKNTPCSTIRGEDFANTLKLLNALTERAAVL